MKVGIRSTLSPSIYLQSRGPFDSRYQSAEDRRYSLLFM